jgi:hypothetical protein
MNDLEERRKQFENEKCNPEKYWVIWCVDYFNNNSKCPRTCSFVVKEDTKRLFEEYENGKRN